MRAWSSVPIIVLSARTGEDQKIAALDAGADDYVTKPFAAAELLARVRAALRRTATGEARSARLVLGGRIIDLARREVTGGGDAGASHAARVSACWRTSRVIPAPSSSRMR